MLDPSLRPLKAKLLEPLASRVAPVPPSALTGLGLVCGLASALALLVGATPLALPLWLLNRLLDGLDGEIARRTGRQSDLGGYLDILADHVVYAALPLALAFSSDTSLAWLTSGLLLGSFYINAAAWMYLSALLEKRARVPQGTTSVVMPSGLIEGTETILFYTAMLLFPATFAALGLAMAALVALTSLQRLLWARSRLAELP